MMKTLQVVASFLFLFFFIGCSSVPTNPKAEWNPSKVERAIMVGDKKPIRLTLSIKEDIPETIVETTQSLENVVIAIKPNRLPALTAGSEVTIDLVLSANVLGISDGTIQLRSAEKKKGKSGRGGTRTLAKPLPIEVDGTATIDETLPPPEPEGKVEFTDSDEDGVPDDAQRVIELSTHARKEKEILRQAALADVLKFDESTWNAAYIATQKAASCAFAAYDGDFLNDRLPVILAMHKTHPERLESFVLYNSSLSTIQETLTFEESLIPVADEAECTALLEELQ